MFRGARVLRIGLKNRVPSENSNPGSIFHGNRCQQNRTQSQRSRLRYGRCRQMSNDDKNEKRTDRWRRKFTAVHLRSQPNGCRQRHLHVSNLRQRKSDRFFLPIVRSTSQESAVGCEGTRQHWVDVECVVKYKKFGVHKAILAARSRVFAAELMKGRPERDGPKGTAFLKFKSMAWIL